MVKRGPVRPVRTTKRKRRWPRQMLLLAKPSSKDRAVQSTVSTLQQSTDGRTVDRATRRTTQKGSLLFPSSHAGASDRGRFALCHLVAQGDGARPRPRPRHVRTFDAAGRPATTRALAVFDARRAGSIGRLTRIDDRLVGQPYLPAECTAPSVPPLPSRLSKNRQGKYSICSGIMRS